MSENNNSQQNPEEDKINPKDQKQEPTAEEEPTVAEPVLNVPDNTDKKPISDQTEKPNIKEAPTVAEPVLNVPDDTDEKTISDQTEEPNTKEAPTVAQPALNVPDDTDEKPRSDQTEEPNTKEAPTVVEPASNVPDNNDEKTISNQTEGSKDAEFRPESLEDPENIEKSKTSESKDEKKLPEKKEELPEKVKLSGHTVPIEPGWRIKMNKTGFTIPKPIRESIHPDQDFFLLQKGFELQFYMINEEDIPNLNLVKKKKQKSGAGKRKGKSGKKPEGPQPEWGKYFLFEFEENNKVQEVLDSAFKKFALNPPNIQEGMDIIKYALVSFIKSSRMNDARLRQTILFFLCDIIEKFDLPNLIEFIKEKIVKEIKSRYLNQLALNQLAYTSFKMKKYEKAQEFIQASMEDIEKYTESENYAIMDSFKNLVVKLTRGVEFLIPQDQMLPIRDSLKTYLVKMEDNDYKIQIVDLLDRMGFTDEAYNIAEEILNSLPEESTSKEEIKEIMKELSSKFI